MQISVDCDKCDAIFHVKVSRPTKSNTVVITCPFCNNQMVEKIDGDEDE